MNEMDQPYQDADPETRFHHWVEALADHPERMVNNAAYFDAVQMLARKYLEHLAGASPSTSAPEQSSPRSSSRDTQ
jgi:hypothetical protein